MNHIKISSLQLYNANCVLYWTLTHASKVNNFPSYEAHRNAKEGQPFSLCGQLIMSQHHLSTYLNTSVCHRILIL